MKTPESSNPSVQSWGRCAILGMFLLIFFLPLLLTPLLMVDKVFPEKIRLQSLIFNLTDIQDSFIAPKPSISLETWFNGKFQEQFNRYFSQKFFLRKPFIQLTNQLFYTFFDKSYMYDQTIIIGKEKYLYELAYIHDYCRLNPPLDPDQTEALARDIGEVQKQLKKRGVTFLVLITPSKASFYPKYIPDVFMKRKTVANRDYENMIPLFRKYGINFVDGHEITLDAQRKSDIPLFCRGGTHWNYLGAFFTIEQLIEKIEALKGLSLSHLTFSEVKLDRKPEGSDKDLASLLHLLFPPYDYITPHPDIKAVSAQNDFRGDIVFVGASFSAQVFDILCMNGIFRSTDSYFYYRNSLRTFPYDKVRESAFKVENIDWERDFFKKDIIVLEINEIAFKSGYIYAFLTDALRHLSLGRTP
jgi:hypothetical protein